jgi:hypothetical protein
MSAIGEVREAGVKPIPKEKMGLVEEWFRTRKSEQERC